MKTSILTIKKEQGTVIQINLNLTGIKNFLKNSWSFIQDCGAAAAAARDNRTANRTR